MSMWTITKSSWVARYRDYRTGKLDAQIGGPASVYYRKSDIAKALSHYNQGRPVDIDSLRPSSEWNDYTDVGALVSANVSPYRIVR